MVNSKRTMKKSKSFGTLADLGLSLPLSLKLKKNTIGHTDSVSDITSFEDSQSLNALDMVSMSALYVIHTPSYSHTSVSNTLSLSGL